MTKIYLTDRAALGFFGKPASQSFWDDHWRPKHLMQHVTAQKKNFFSMLVATYLSSWDGPVLEGGCGLGQNVFALKMSGYKAVGVDYAEETIRRLHEAVPDLDIRLGDVRSLPFDDAIFAGYLSLGVIEHFWHGYDAILSEMNRVVKPGGYVFLTVPYMSPLRQAKAAAGFYDTRPPEHPENAFYQFALNPRRVIRRFDASGFHLVHKQPMDGIKGFKDEVPFGRKWLQDLYVGKRRFRYKGLLYEILSRFAGHIMLFVFRKN